MDITEFNEKIFQVIDSLNPKELEAIQGLLFEKGCCENLFDNKLDQRSIKEAVKKGIQKISMEDLESIAPEQIKEIIQEFKETSTDNYYNEDENQDIANLSKQEETKEDLIREAISISAQRLNDREEIPRDLRVRLGYIAAKLNVRFKLSKREITKLINVNNITVTKYISECLTSQPDLVKMWGQTTESKTDRKIEETVAKHVGDKAISTVRDNITLGDGLREKYAIISAQRGYNLYSPGDLEKLVNGAMQLYFSIDSVYTNIISLENENTRLRQQNLMLKEQIEEIEELKQLLLI